MPKLSYLSTKYNPDTTKLTDQEKELLKLSGKLADKWGELQQVHPSDTRDVIYHIHAIQNILLARSAYTWELRDGTDSS